MNEPRGEDIEIVAGAARSGVAVVLCRTDVSQLHVGLRYRSRAGEPVIHLGFYRYLFAGGRDKFAKGAAPWAVIDLDLEAVQASAVNALCGAVADWSRTGKSARYALSASDLAIEGDGSIPLTSEFTCATFVIALLRAGGIELIELNSWPDPDDADRAWQAKICGRLADYVRKLLPKLPEGSAERARAERDREDFAQQLGVGTKRVRPSHVAAAAARPSGDRAVRFEHVEETHCAFDALL